MTNDSNMMVRLPGEQKIKILKLAAQLKVTPSEIVRRAIEQFQVITKDK